jgi:hypothetical protein
MPWLKSLNLYAIGVLVVLGGVIVAGIFNAGEQHNQMKHDGATAKVNIPIVEDRGKDEAEVPANDQAGKATADAVAGAVSQTCVLTPETVKLLAGLR